VDDGGDPERHADGRASAEQAIAASAPFAEPERLGSVDSTNRYLLDAASAGRPEGAVVIADEQTAGRGRLGRRWVAPRGTSLLCSLLFRPRLPTDRLHLLTGLVALAACDACREVAGVEARLKWPNDVVVAGRKLAGILAESLPGGGAGEIAVVVGIGMNLNWPAGWSPREEGDVRHEEAVRHERDEGDERGEGDEPDELAALASTATALNRAAGSAVDAEAVLGVLLHHVRTRYASLSEETGWRRQMSEYRDRSSTIGSMVRVDLAGESFSGRATGVSDEGHLLVEVGTSVRAVSAGDVVHLRAD
jgi:BirA family transcriptional regulator, biotin operon repressor / biotin---[acetyl-CoA-carboxylase] ligase